jgi:hypothetical protein
MDDDAWILRNKKAAQSRCTLGAKQCRAMQIDHKVTVLNAAGQKFSHHAA